jgi:hypothetical protein
VYDKAFWILNKRTLECFAIVSFEFAAKQFDADDGVDYEEDRQGNILWGPRAHLYHPRGAFLSFLICLSSHLQGGTCRKSGNGFFGIYAPIYHSCFQFAQGQEETRAFHQTRETTRQYLNEASQARCKHSKETFLLVYHHALIHSHNQ